MKAWRSLVFFSHENAFRNQNELPNNTCSKVGQNVDETHSLRYHNVIWVLNMMLIKTFLTSFKPIYTLKFETNISKDLI